MPWPEAPPAQMCAWRIEAHSQACKRATGQARQAECTINHHQPAMARDFTPPDRTRELAKVARTADQQCALTHSVPGPMYAHKQQAKRGDSATRFIG